MVHPVWTDQLYSAVHSVHPDSRDGSLACSLHLAVGSCRLARRLDDAVRCEAASLVWGFRVLDVPVDHFFF